jgi:hypothetical protein
VRLVTGVSKRTVLLAAIATCFVLAPLGAYATSSGPNGRIAFVDSSTRLAVATADLTTVNTDTDPGATGASSPSWAPASQQIAYVQAGSIRVVTYTFSSGAFGAPATVAGTVGVVAAVAWSPDGSTLAYASLAGGATNIHTIPAGGGTDRQLTFSGAGIENTSPAWAPDNTKIAFSSNRDGNDEIYVMNATDGGGQTRLTTSAGSDLHPTWSPDGSRIAFDSDRDGVEQVYAVPATGGPETKLTNEAASDADPTYSPDGSLLAVEHGANIQTVGASGGNPAAGGVPGTDPDWGLLFGPLVPPTINPSSGITTGTTVTASDGTWSATPQSFAYQWLRCNSAGAACTTISGATSKTYTITSAEDGFTLRVTVTATVSSGSASSTSAATALIQQSLSVAGQPPTVMEVPALSVTPPFGQTPPAGQILVGSTFGAGLGTWRGQFPLSFAYQWKKCDPSGFCYAIPGATSSTFTPGIDLYNWRIAVGVIATNSLGRAEATSQPWGPLVALAPRGSITPPITGSNVVGQTLSVGTGTFTGTAPFTYAYQWRRCDAPGTIASCVPIAGATSATYTLTQADLGATVRAYITGTNVAGSDTLITNHSFPTLPKPKFSPSATQAPSILGTVILGYTLTAATGSWTGDVPITYALQWQRCDATGASCVTVSKKRTYRLSVDDLSMRLRLFVTATNDNGSVSSTSGLTEPIQLVPHRKGRRIVGTAKPNYLAGSGFDDTIFGGGGNDTLLAGAGADRLFGGAGGDVLVGGSGSDRIFGGPGSDTVMAADGERDTVDCGPGSDRAVVDAIDVVANCESVQVTGSTLPAPTTSSTTSTTTSSTTSTTSSTTTTLPTTTRP